MSYLENGVVTIEDLQLPTEERMKQGRVIVIECVQHIPCNPCVDICPQGAITITGEITNVPVVDFEKCSGCTLCVANCPGLAIFSINQTYSEAEAEIGIPYEFLPLPSKGEDVTALDRSGRPVCEGRIVSVKNPKAYDRTPIVFIAVPEKYSMTVRFFRRKD
ncbi:4Fe-4S binding protein [candidate division KSB1 bacterium]|nr:4Fe-4S binding protein [candidate division KSB1 bacterium]